MARKIQEAEIKALNVRLTPEAKRAIVDWVTANDEELGKTVSKLVLWFTKADPLVQAVILGRVVPRMANAHVAALRQLADEREASDKSMTDKDLSKPIAPPGDINVILHPDQFGKKKGKRTG